MTPNDIERAVVERLDTAALAPVAIPNDVFEPNGEYLEFRHSPTSGEDPVLAGGFAYDLGLLLVTVVTPAGGFSDRANELAESVRDLFPKALRLTRPSGILVVTERPNLGTGFQDGSYWRQPVVISYMTEQN